MDNGKTKKLIQARWTENTFPEIQAHLLIDLSDTNSGIIWSKAKHADDLKSMQLAVETEEPSRSRAESTNKPR